MTVTISNRAVDWLLRLNSTRRGMRRAINLFICFILFFLPRLNSRDAPRIWGNKRATYPRMLNYDWWYFPTLTFLAYAFARSVENHLWSLFIHVRALIRNLKAYRYWRFDWYSNFELFPMCFFFFCKCLEKLQDWVSITYTRIYTLIFFCFKPTFIIQSIIILGKKKTFYYILNIFDVTYMHVEKF